MPSSPLTLFYKRLDRLPIGKQYIALRNRLSNVEAKLIAAQKLAASGVYVTTEKYTQLCQIIEALSGGCSAEQVLQVAHNKEMLYDLGRPETTLQLKAGDKVWFKEERIGYTVTASTSRFAICTKPFLLQEGATFIYTIIDWYEQVRGPDNLVFGIHDYNIPAKAQRAVEDLMDCEEAYRERIIDNKWREGKLQISHRRRRPLKIRKIEIS